MNPTETGKMIARLRKEAGYTQASLAKALFVTDKAVSKWECGNGLPDPSLLPALAKLLDCDLEVLLAGKEAYRVHEWRGLLILGESGIPSATPVFDKPLLFYLLSYFLLVGITDVDIAASGAEREYIKGLRLEEFGLHISFGVHQSCNLMIVSGKALLFGPNLTRNLQNMMSAGENLLPVIDDREVPILFSHYCTDTDVLQKTAERKKWGRGYLFLPMTTPEEIEDASAFVRMYQTQHQRKIAALAEIAANRGILCK